MRADGEVASIAQCVVSVVYFPGSTGINELPGVLSEHSREALSTGHTWWLLLALLLLGGLGTQPFLHSAQ